MSTLAEVRSRDSYIQEIKSVVLGSSYSGFYWHAIKLLVEIAYLLIDIREILKSKETK